MRRAGRPILAVLAMAFGCASYIYLTLPDVRDLRAENPETTAFMELRAEQALARGEKPRRVQRWVPYARLSRHLKSAVLVAEDSMFWQHDGVDYQQMRESISVNFERGEFARGASTITQQLAKNLYLSPAKNPVRKLRELMIARRLEAELSKQRILELYLNVIEWGNGIYGADAAARKYFGRPASDISAQEAALLASTIVSPRALDPARPNARVLRRQQMILKRMGLLEPEPVIADPRRQADPSALPAVAAPTRLPGQVVPATPKPPGRVPGGNTPLH